MAIKPVDTDFAQAGRSIPSLWVKSGVGHDENILEFDAGDTGNAKLGLAEVLRLRYEIDKWCGRRWRQGNNGQQRAHWRTLVYELLTS